MAIFIFSNFRPLLLVGLPLVFVYPAGTHPQLSFGQIEIVWKILFPNAVNVSAGRNDIRTESYSGYRN